MKRNVSLYFIILSVFLLLSACTRVDVDQIGVRVNNYGANKGVVPRDFTPGYHIKLANMHTWHFYPSTVQIFAMTKNAQFRKPGDRGPLQLRTADGFDILVDVFVYYKIRDDAAHLLLEDIGPQDRYQDIVATMAVDGCMAVFGTMVTEDFYSPQVRREKLLETRDFMHTNLVERNIEVIQVLILDVDFDPKFEQIIKEKKLADQRVLLNQSENRLAAQQGVTNKIFAETEGMIKLIQQQAQATVDSIHAEANKKVQAIAADANKFTVETRAEADLISKQKEAEGSEALRLAGAESNQMITKSLAGADGQNVAALEAVRNLNIKQVTFSSVGEDWLDVVNMAKRLSGEANKK